MEHLHLLKEEFARTKNDRENLSGICDYLMCLGYKDHYSDDPLTASASFQKILDKVNESAANLD